MKTFWIIGAGRFGHKAVATLGRHFPGAERVIVDSDADALNAFGPASGLSLVLADGVDFVCEAMDRGRAVDWILPLLPVHLAWAWIGRQLSGADGRRPLDVPEAVAARLPNPFRGADGAVYVSYADFLCPEDCPEPSDICTHTGKPRIGILYRALAQVAWKNFTSVVVRSRQLAPGMGGYGPAALRTALKEVQNASGPVLISTACKCHGVVNALGPPMGSPSLDIGN